MSENKGFLIVVSGPSAVGKGTVVSRTMDKAGEQGLNLYLSMSLTSRPIREGEEEGIHYHFVSFDEFKKLVKRRTHTEYK